MKKNIAYYLEDPERLSEISLHELNKWVEEMPYSQPLRLLVDLKSDQFVSSVDEDSTRYGTYFAEDYEPLSLKKAEKLVDAKLEDKKVDIAPPMDDTVEESSLIESSEHQLLADEASTDMEGMPHEDNHDHTSGLIEGEEMENAEITDDASVEVESTIEEPAVLTHSLVDDTSEDMLEDDLLEVNPNVTVVNEISHSEADEVLEDELEKEVLEITEDDLDDLLVDEEGLETDVVELNDSESENLLEEQIEKEAYAGLVDYKSYAVGLSDDELELTSEVPKEITEEAIVTKNKKKSKKPKNKAKKELKKKKSKKKTSAKASKIAEKAAKKVKEKSIKEKSQKVKAKKRSDKKSKKVKALKIKRSDKIKNKKANFKTEDGSVKKIKGSIVTNNLVKEPKSIKAKAKKTKREVKYVVVNESNANDFKLKDYDGVSKFTNWLLEQKSINGANDDNPIQKDKIVGKKKGKRKDKKKKKKGKKSKVLQVAQDSVKKSEMILSEPLANIMAAQGHTKKAKKMYKQLGLIFPEKSSYFASKIENLKKK